MNKTIKKELTPEEKEIIRVKAVKYYQKNKEIILAKKKLFRETYPDKVKANKKKEYEINKKNHKERKLKWYQDNLEYVKKYGKQYRKNNLEKRKISAKIYRDNNRDKIRKHAKEIRDTNDLVKLIDNTRRLLRYGFESKNIRKNTKSELILGCSFTEFKVHLESKFESWMSWENYGNPKDGILELNKTWDIDHKEPISNAKTEYDVISLNHYTNLQPLCSYTNRFIKRNNYE